MCVCTAVLKTYPRQLGLLHPYISCCNIVLYQNIKFSKNHTTRDKFLLYIYNLGPFGDSLIKGFGTMKKLAFAHFKLAPVVSAMSYSNHFLPVISALQFLSGLATTKNILFAHLQLSMYTGSVS